MATNSRAASGPQWPIRVLHTLPNMTLGGGQILLLRNVTSFDPRLVESFVCAVWRDDKNAISGQYTANGIPVLNLELRRSRLPLAIAKLVRYARDNRINLIHTNNTPWDRRFGVAAGRICGIPVVNTFHSMYFPCPWRAWDRWLLRGRYRRATAVSKAVRHAWAAHISGVGLSHEQVDVVYPGVDPDRFGVSLRSEQERALRTELGLCDDVPVLTSIARLVRGKGIIQLVEMLQRVREHLDAQLLLVGDGGERQNIEQAVHSRGLQDVVHFAGRRDDVSDLLSISDVFVFASQGEGLGLVAIEAMAARLPVVAYRIPALTEVIRDGEDGYLVSLGNPEAMAQAVIELLSDPGAHRRIGETARQTVCERFSHTRSVRALEDTYLKALGLTRPNDYA